MLYKITHGKNLSPPLSLSGRVFDGMSMDAGGTYTLTAAQVQELRKRGYTLAPLQLAQRSASNARAGSSGELSIPLEVYRGGRRR